MISYKATESVVVNLRYSCVLRNKASFVRCQPWNRRERTSLLTNLTKIRLELLDPCTEQKPAKKKAERMLYIILQNRRQQKIFVDGLDSRQ